MFVSESPPSGRPVAFVSVAEVGVPRIGVTKVGDVAKTAAPLPVSSLNTPASCAEVVAANCDSGLPVTPHVAHAIVPVVVIVPPVIGLVVATEVTVPPLPVALSTAPDDMVRPVPSVTSSKLPALPDRRPTNVLAAVAAMKFAYGSRVVPTSAARSTAAKLPAPAALPW